LELLSALSLGDADIGDMASEFRSEGIESLEDVLAVIREAARQRKADEAQAIVPIDLQALRTKASPEDVASIVQRAPEVPFILNGVEYDPEDIQRFNGKELHFIPAKSGDHLLVVDDRELMGRWLQFTYLSTESDVIAESDFVAGPFVIPLPVPSTYYYEHTDFSGSLISNRPNRGYQNLLNVSLGLFDDWNDKISSVKMDRTRVCVLYDHINWGGQTLTLTASARNLFPWGWNDRASSVATW
jgi:hypothetical protein